MDLSQFRQPNSKKALAVVLTSLVPFLFLMALSYWLYDYSYWWVIALAIPAHWFHARLFIIMHDSGHNSFTKNATLNTLLGHISGFFFYTPFLMWRQLHNRHHTNQGNLDRRHHSLDIWLLTTSEYQQAHFFKKALYRFYRNPFVFCMLGPFVLFLGVFRFPFEHFHKKIVSNILFLNLLIMGIFYFAYKNEILLKLILVQAPTFSLSFILAIWLFYAQHQFEDTVWFREDSYDFEKVGLYGSSYYQTSPFVNWWTGNIGFHHVHHLDARIPMYRLPEAHLHLTQFYKIKGLHISQTFQLMKLKLWDEALQKMVGF
ncbi:MAG: hypothetical protein A2622_09905 [Bdellovibrionales bacterium RIFCSPHIGHO2_01_FULL_40_29]|nr:MAG: hypothetical protein A2622_09905 [Bdellovibrionales bacterium RIFCSPHIGHO2_01_FULL_40_29]OFZ32438.1 MAG: hypothetical protein A3D17_12755 [Bdellovibrionales bacterium RIFCSPHIGHO2_02_FULL_40_15]